MNTGIKSTTTGVLLIKAEATPTVTMMMYGYNPDSHGRLHFFNGLIQESIESELGFKYFGQLLE